MTIAGRSLKPRNSPSATLIAAVALLLILFVTSAFFFVLPDTRQSPELIAIGEQNRAMHAEWIANRPLEFRYVVDRSCACTTAYTQPYSVISRHGSDDVAWYRPTTDALDPETPPEALVIDDLFALIDRASAEAASLEVSYNSRFAYPARVVIDWSADLDDDGERYDVFDFEVLQYN